MLPALRARSLLALLLALLVAGAPSTGRADAPPRIPVFGVLTSDGGAAVTGQHTLLLSLYATPEGGTALYDETQTLTLVDGRFSTFLGAVQPLDLSLFAGRMDAMYLGVTVDQAAEMKPRFELASEPFAGFAQYCGRAQTLEGLSAKDFARADHSHGTGGSALPADLADGDQDTGITQITSAGWLATSQSGRSIRLTPRIKECPAGSAIRAIDERGEVACTGSGSGSGGALSHIFNPTGEQTYVLLDLPDFALQAQLTATGAMIVGIVPKGTNRKAVTMMGGADPSQRVANLSAATTLVAKDIGSIGAMDVDVLVLETYAYHRFHCFRGAQNIITCDHTQRQHGE